jgi:hypothetical protein
VISFPKRPFDGDDLAVLSRYLADKSVEVYLDLAFNPTANEHVQFADPDMASPMVGDRDIVVAMRESHISKPITSETFVADVGRYLHKQAGRGDDPGR